MLMKMSLETFNIVISMLSSKSQLQAVCRGAVGIQADTLVFLLVFKWFSKKIPVTQEQKKNKEKNGACKRQLGKNCAKREKRQERACTEGMKKASQGCADGGERESVNQRDLIACHEH